MEKKIILLTDMIDARVRKEQELKFYQEQLEKLQSKMFLLQKDIDITNLCIKLIENERVVDFKQQLLEKNKDE